MAPTMNDQISGDLVLGPVTWKPPVDLTKVIKKPNPVVTPAPVPPPSPTPAPNQGLLGGLLGGLLNRR